MTLKEELEILRGEPIGVFTGDPMDIPCIETSDPERLCKHPVVSVQMITYNHEPYIRRAIEGVMMQKTDFEFELVIGEDASTDKTREICFEYQKRYPDKIRVLWWHENLRKVNHPAGGNASRTSIRCRGEFRALCEGDDYWIDPLKLQKQVDVMRRHPHVGFCFASGKIKVEGRTEVMTWNANGTWHPGVVPGREVLLKNILGVRFDEGGWPAATFLLTASALVRVSVLRRAAKTFEIFRWKLWLGDTTLWLGLAALGDAYCLADEVSVYNQVSTGLCQKHGMKVADDALVVRSYFAICALGLPLSQLSVALKESIYWKLVVDRRQSFCEGNVRKCLLLCKRLPHLKAVVFEGGFAPLTFIGRLLNRMTSRMLGWYAAYLLDPAADSQWIRDEYRKIGVLYRNDQSCGLFRRIYRAIIRKGVMNLRCEDL